MSLSDSPIWKMFHMLTLKNEQNQVVLFLCLYTFHVSLYYLKINIFIQKNHKILLFMSTCNMYYADIIVICVIVNII